MRRGDGADHPDHATGAYFIVLESLKRTPLEHMDATQLLTMASVRAQLALSDSIREWTMTLREVNAKRNGNG